jgi:hypothetical protein
MAGIQNREARRIGRCQVAATKHVSPVTETQATIEEL